jgi:hypothetical protein
MSAYLLKVRDDMAAGRTVWVPKFRKQAWSGGSGGAIFQTLKLQK